MAKYVASEGSEPRLVKGTATGDAMTVFRSTAGTGCRHKRSQVQERPRLPAGCHRETGPVEYFLRHLLQVNFMSRKLQNTL